MANGAGGVIEIVGAPSNPNVLYMLWQTHLYVSVNKGTNWFITTLTTTQNANNNNQKARGPYIAVDPNNADIVYIGTDLASSKTTNGTASASGGTTTFSTVTGIGTATTYGNIWCFAQGSSSHIITGTYSDGFYESINSGGNWSKITGSTITMSQVYADKFGQFWFIDNGQTNLYKYASGSITSLSPGNGQGITVSFASDPTSASVGANHIMVTDFTGQLNLSTDNGATWSEATRTNNQTFTATAPQPVWLGVANQGSGNGNLNGWSVIFDASGNIQFAGGLGVWLAPAPIVTNGTVWASNNVGIEQLTSVLVVSSAGNSPTAGVWDKGFFKIANPDVFPSTYWDSNSSLNPILGGWAVDWASNNSYFFTGWESSNISASLAPASSTNGANTWTLWGTSPSHIGVQGGVIAALTSQKWALVTSPGETMAYTLNGGTNWNTSTISGTPTNWVGNTGVGIQLAADRVAPDTYCAFRANGGAVLFYKSTDAGVNFASTAATVDGSINESFVRSVPGQSGHFWYTSGGQGGSHPAATHLWKSTNACTSFASVNANVAEVIAFGFGADPPTGGTYGVTAYIYGWYNSVLGFYQSIDGGATWTAINIPGSQTPWPLNSADLVQFIEGDANIYGRIYLMFRGSGGTYIDTADACPWVNFTNTNPNAALTGTVTLQAQHSGLVPVSSVNFYVDGSLIGTQTSGSGTPTTYSQSWVTGGVAHGAHTLKVEAVGNGCTNAGNSFSIPITTSQLIANDNTPMWLNEVG
jgi:hypothetical protein